VKRGYVAKPLDAARPDDLVELWVVDDALSLSGHRASESLDE
jgi:hypothetical protein